MGKNKKADKVVIGIPELKGLVQMIPCIQVTAEAVVNGTITKGEELSVTLYNDKRKSPAVDGTTVTLHKVVGYVAINENQYLFTESFILKVIPEIIS